MRVFNKKKKKTSKKVKLINSKFFMRIHIFIVIVIYELICS